MKKIILSIATLLLGLTGLQAANDVVSLTFSRTGSDASSVTVNVVDSEGVAINGASATIVSSHTLKATAGDITSSILCPNANANTSPTIELTLQVSGLPTDFTFSTVRLDIHAFNGAGNYQQNSDNVVRQWNVAVATGSSADAVSTFGTLTDIDIAAGVGKTDHVHKVWEMTTKSPANASNPLIVKITITKGTTNGGCFFGLSEVRLGTADTDPAPEPEPEPEGEFDANKVYYITWKNTGSNYITESTNKALSVSAKSTGRYQFWRFIPTDSEGCYYIQNVVTERYIGSCNLTPSSSSRVTTTETPTAYYIGNTAATSGEIAGCHYLSSTDCADYRDESKGPRALNKDGASSYIITWQAGTSRPGSYWTITATDDTYQRPEPPIHNNTAKALNIYFNPCGISGNVYLTAAHLTGDGALDPLIYEASSKPDSWHIPYSRDHGAVLRGTQADLAITLSATPDATLKANAYFDWDADGIFEATQPILLKDNKGTASITVPANAAEGNTRMRIRINSNGLDYAEDDVEGFVYDFPLTAADTHTERKVTITVNDTHCGTATLPSGTGHYAVGTELTATATPKGDATFINWREGGVVISTDASYTFIVKNRNMSLKAYFTDNTLPDEDESEGIIQTTDSQSKSTTYDLSGRPADSATKGIYIKNEKKVLVR